ncbi:MAG: hypothetical protein ABUS79_05970, partial [Pseudomonadota bacterium]
GSEGGGTGGNAAGSGGSAPVGTRDAGGTGAGGSNGSSGTPAGGCAIAPRADDRGLGAAALSIVALIAAARRARRRALF